MIDYYWRESDLNFIFFIFALWRWGLECFWLQLDVVYNRVDKTFSRLLASSAGCLMVTLRSIFFHHGHFHKVSNSTCLHSNILSKNYKIWPQKSQNLHTCIALKCLDVIFTIFWPKCKDFNSLFVDCVGVDVKGIIVILLVMLLILLITFATLVIIVIILVIIVIILVIIVIILVMLVIIVIIKCTRAMCVLILQRRVVVVVPQMTNSDNRPAAAAKINQPNQNHLCQFPHPIFWNMESKKFRWSPFHKTVETEVPDSEMFT